MAPPTPWKAGRGCIVQAAPSPPPPCPFKAGCCHDVAEDKSRRSTADRQLCYRFGGTRLFRVKWPSAGGCGNAEQKELTRRVRTRWKRSCHLCSFLLPVSPVAVFFAIVFGVFFFALENEPDQADSRGPAFFSLALQVISQVTCSFCSSRPPTTPSPLSFPTLGHWPSTPHSYPRSGTALPPRCSAKCQSRVPAQGFFSFLGRKKEAEVCPGLDNAWAKNRRRHPSKSLARATCTHSGEEKHLLQLHSQQLKKHLGASSEASSTSMVQAPRRRRLCQHYSVFGFVWRPLPEGHTRARRTPPLLFVSSLDRHEAFPPMRLSITVFGCSEGKQAASRATTNERRLSGSLLKTPEVALKVTPPRKRRDAAHPGAQGGPELGQVAKGFEVRPQVDSRKQRGKARSKERMHRVSSGRTGASLQSVEEAFVQVLEAVSQGGFFQGCTSRSPGPVSTTSSSGTENVAAPVRGGGEAAPQAPVAKTAEKIEAVEPTGESGQAERLEGVFQGQLSRTGAEEGREAHAGGLHHSGGHTDGPSFHSEVSPAVSEAVSNFRRAAQELLGIPVAVRRQKEDETRQVAALSRAEVRDEEARECRSRRKRQCSQRGDAAKSCVWFDLTKQRLMVDRTELMRQLGEPAKGGWTLRFLGTGSMQPSVSVTRLTSSCPTGYSLVSYSPLWLSQAPRLTKHRRANSESREPLLARGTFLRYVGDSVCAKECRQGALSCKHILVAIDGP